ncbi:hypothetical protein HMPREF1987_00746 [Peptostreptococcaceae bacterium oral taxon 113 str. W5053]|nr:hypothetical protein HMPREF1987_00746 [Peptostreptococcaceae bacterium oral taxon 113 str. W5053]
MGYLIFSWSTIKASFFIDSMSFTRDVFTILAISSNFSSDG